MKMNRITLAAIFGFAVAPSLASAAVVSISEGDFVNQTVETFSAQYAKVPTYDFGNGMVHTNTNAASDHVNYTGSYGMVLDPSINGGRNGGGYFGTGPTPTSFELAFAGGITQFGFYGAESRVSDGSLGRNGELDLKFFDMSDNLLAAIAVSTAGTFAWDQFHGFESDVAIGRVLFDNVGHMVLDDVTFANNATPAVPLPAAGLMLVGALSAFAGLRRKR